MAEVERTEKKKNGGARPGSGMKKGQKTRKTLEREASRKAYEQLVLENLRPIFHKQLWLAMGQTYVYRIDKHKAKGEPTRIEHVLLEEPHEIADALDILANGDQNGDETGSGFYYVVTKPPENRAIDSMLDRSIGSAKQSVDLTSGGKVIKGNTIVLARFKDEAGSK